MNRKYLAAIWSSVAFVGAVAFEAPRNIPWLLEHNHESVAKLAINYGIKTLGAQKRSDLLRDAIQAWDFEMAQLIAASGVKDPALSETLDPEIHRAIDDGSVEQRDLLFGIGEGKLGLKIPEDALSAAAGSGLGGSEAVKYLLAHKTFSEEEKEKAFRDAILNGKDGGAEVTEILDLLLTHFQPSEKAWQDAFKDAFDVRWASGDIVEYLMSKHKFSPEKQFELVKKTLEFYDEDGPMYGAPIHVLKNGDIPRSQALSILALLRRMQAHFQKSGYDCGLQSDIDELTRKFGQDEAHPVPSHQYR